MNTSCLCLLHPPPPPSWQRICYCCCGPVLVDNLPLRCARVKGKLQRKSEPNSPEFLRRSCLKTAITHKMFVRYYTVSAVCSQARWRALTHPVEVLCRVYTGTSSQWFLKSMQLQAPNWDVRGASGSGSSRKTRILGLAAGGRCSESKWANHLQGGSADEPAAPNGQQVDPAVFTHVLQVTTAELQSCLLN